MQYTIRNIPADLDQAARECARREGISLNQALVKAIRSGLGLEQEPAVRRVLPTSFDGAPLEPEVLEALDEQRQVDPRDWE